MTMTVSAWTIFSQFLKLGCTSFGGPVAHIGFFREVFVVRQSWFDEAQFARWTALCHFLPGPSSSQLGFLIGYQQAGWVGAMAAFVGFTLPSAIIMALLAYGWVALDDTWRMLLQALIIVAAAVVLKTIWQMSQAFCQSWILKSVMLLSILPLFLMPVVWVPILWLIMLAAIGPYLSVSSDTNASSFKQRTPSVRQGVFLISSAVALLVIIPVISQFFPHILWQISEGFYRAGAMVFGGGHVVLPFLELEWVQTQQVSEEAFLAGYGVAQALPGPLFTFASYLGVLLGGVPGAVLATFSIFLAGFLLVIGVLPFYQKVTQSKHLQKSLTVIQAGVVGFLVFAFVNMILPHAVINWQSGVMLLLNGVLLFRFHWSVLSLMLVNVMTYFAIIQFL
uniref:Chromate ion (CHR) family transporter n=1 Tax=Hydrogenovibrio crunogenus (strain DSM 25203 / XCL-2) TaxID=317025 RepID=Q31EY2_HYDCU